MLTIATLKQELELLLCDCLGTWVRGDGSTAPSIHSGYPPRGTKMVAPGVQCIVLDTADLTIETYLGGVASLGKLKLMIDLELWMPEDLETPRLNDWAEVLTLNGLCDSPVERIMTYPGFLHYGPPLNPANTPRTQTTLAHSLVYVSCYNDYGYSPACRKTYP